MANGRGLVRLHGDVTATIAGVGGSDHDSEGSIAVARRDGEVDVAIGRRSVPPPAR